MRQKRSRVYVGLSGGVDSSVSAALLLRSGYAVTGVFIKIWSPEWTECTSKEDRLDAMRVCAHLGIPFKEIDLTEEYKREVVDYMISEYAKGRTPNPDVMCNRFIKFGIFFDWAIQNGADFVATGHYAQIKNEKGVFQLKISKDAGKDQTYFLWTLKQKHLCKTLFPVGGFQKIEVRRLAKKFKLPTTFKKDSQGLCFVGHIDIKQFLSLYVPKKRGNVLNERGEIVGYHNGAHLLTIGERHGFVITKKTTRDTPFYVVSKNIEHNVVTVAKKKDRALKDTSIFLSSINWIEREPDIEAIYEAQIRYHGKRYACKIKGVVVDFLNKPDSLAPGQSLVLYDKDECLGGGIMDVSHV